MDFLTFLRTQWDRVGAWVAISLGAIFLIIGWLGVSNTAYTAEQIPYVLSGGLGGIFFLGLGAMLWLSADLRDEWRLLAELREQDDDEKAVAVADGEVVEEPVAAAPSRAPRPSRRAVGAKR